MDRCKEGTGREQYLLFPLFVPLECGGAPCLLGLVLQELCGSLFLFEHVELVVQGLLLVLQFLFLVLVELLQTVKLLVQLCGGEKTNNTSCYFRRELRFRDREGSKFKDDTSFSASLSSASFSLTLWTNICLISSSFFCSSPMNSFLLAS